MGAELVTYLGSGDLPAHLVGGALTVLVPVALLRLGVRVVYRSLGIGR